MRQHPLRREIVATYVTNSMINRVGSTFVHRMHEETGARAAEIVRAYILTRAVFNLVRLWKAIEALDNRVADAVQSAMLIEAGRLIVRASLWMLRNRRQAQPLALAIDHFAPGVSEVEATLEKLLPPVEAAALAQEVGKYAAAGVPQELARRVAGLDALYAALDIVEVASADGRSIAAVAATYFALGGRLNFAWLRKQTTALSTENHWQTLARAALRDDLASQQRALTAAVLQLSPNLHDANELIGVWEAKSRSSIERVRQVIADLQAAGSLDLSMLSVALRELRNLA